MNKLHVFISELAAIKLTVLPCHSVATRVRLGGRDVTPETSREFYILLQCVIFFYGRCGVNVT